MAYCRQCGAALQEGTRFCSECGAPVESVPVRSMETQIENLADKPKKKIVVSSYLDVQYADKTWALYAANEMDYGKYFANYAVYERQIRDAKDDGRKTFDVFGTAGRKENARNAAGLYEFKRKWGGEFVEFIGEFDYVINKPMYYVYQVLIPVYHRIVNRRLTKSVQQAR